MRMREAPAVPIASSPDAPPTLKRIRRGTKLSALLRAFLARGEQGLNRFEAERFARDHVLPSSVSALIRLYGFTFEREPEQIPGFNGSVVDCMRYRLTSKDTLLAREFLAAGEGD